MAQQGKQGELVLAKVFHAIQWLVLLGNGWRYEVDPNTVRSFVVLKLSIQIKYCPAPTLTFLTNICICSLWFKVQTISYNIAGPYV